MEVLNYEVHNNITDHHDFLSKLKSFCQAQGWTIQTWEPSKIWASIGGGQYGWVSGGEDFLEVRSSGFGSQAMQFRLRLENTGTLNNRWLQLGAFSGTLGYDTLSSVHPVTRASGPVTNWNSYRYFGLSSEVMPTVWFFGNSKVIFYVVKFDSTYVQTSGFGSLDLVDSSETEGFWAGQIHNTDTLTSWEWYDKTAFLCFDQNSNSYRWNGVALTSSTSGDLSFKCAASKYTGGSSDFFSYRDNVLIRNIYSSVRPLFQQDYWCKHTDGKWFLLGRQWVARLQHENLMIGQELTYGSEKYLAFPWRVLDVDTQGFAVRIS